MRGLLKRCDCGCRGSSRRRAIARFRAVLFHCTRVERSCNGGKKVRRATHDTKGKPSHQRERLEHRAQCASTTNARAEFHTMAPPTHCVPIAHLSHGPSRSLVRDHSITRSRAAFLRFSFSLSFPTTIGKTGAAMRTPAPTPQRSHEGASASHAIPVPSCTLCVSHMAVLEWKRWKRWKHC
jgi:hypothetical protein